MAEQPEQLFLGLMRASGVDITDPTEVRCDVCSSEGTSDTKGGYVLQERRAVLSSFTYVCDKCYTEYTCATPEARQQCTGLRAAALRHRIGIDVVAKIRMDPTKTFRENVLCFKKNARQQGARTSWNIQVERRCGTTDQAQDATGQSLRRMCRKCKKDVLSTVIRRCGRCHMAYYCSRECQKEDWKAHRGDCDLLKDA